VKTDSHWKSIGFKPHHGIALPLSALKSRQSSGIGEFLDLIPLIGFCKKINFDTIQLLPINDTDGDTSPYNIISSCALDPVYLSLHALPNSKIPIFECKEWNEAKRVAIPEVKQKKIAWLYLYFQQTFKNIEKETSYQTFLKKHHHWLNPYAQFKAKKNEHQNTHWENWGDAPAQGVDFYFFLQYHCFSQMEKVRAYATKKGCFLQGDIPILLNSNSADVWNHQHLFRRDLVAGAPPDYYNRLGQKWEFPIFNWEAMRKENFAWWKQRLSVASDLYHMYRIDHVVGFFRIWAIPKDQEAASGYFIPTDPHLWENLGREILTMMLEATPLLPIAEDLGTIPPEVPRTLKEFGICGTKVVRWQRRWHDGKEFIPMNEYEPFSLTTVSTHDSETLAMWWKNAPEEAKLVAHEKNWTYRPQLTEQERFDLLYDAHHSNSYFHINLLQEYLALFPELVSPNPEEERINVPGVVLPTNWTYRFSLS
jgi:4-alpha-glucanotransferase